MYMAKQIKDSLTMKPVGILRASIKLSYLKKMTITARDSLAAHIFLLDNDKNVLIESAENDATISDRSWIEKISGNTGEFLFTADGQGYDCVYQRSSDTGLTVVGMIPMSFLQKTARGLQKTTIMLILASLMLCIFLANILAKGIAGPIKRTSKAMQQFAEGDFSVRLPEGRRDEIGTMNSVFNQTIEKIEQLIKQVVEMETVNKDIEFQALQAQINPHFLYNTLDAIGWLCEEERCQDAVEMVNALAKLFRISISKGHELIPIEKEVEHAKSYLKIENYRYKNKFTYSFEVEESCLSYLCNKITLQPIIENAIYHGVKQMIDEGEIWIRIFEDGEDIIFQVEDNGIGMTEEQCREILRKEPGDRTGIGIKNVNDRIKIYFGSNYGLNITSELDEGTCVTIRMPKVREEEYEKK